MDILAHALWAGFGIALAKRRIAAPMVGGMISAPLLSMFVLPAAYLLLRRRRVARGKVQNHPIPIEIPSERIPS